MQNIKKFIDKPFNYKDFKLLIILLTTYPEKSTNCKTYK